MLKNLVIHPFLFSLVPILLIFEYSLHEVPLIATFWPLLFSLLIVSGLWIILRFFIGSKKSGLIVSSSVMFFVTYGFVHTIIINSDSEFSFIGRNMIMGTVFLVLLIVCIFYIVKTKRVLDNTNMLTNTFALVMIGVIITSIAIYYNENPIDFSASYFSDIPFTAKNVPVKPDIYLLIFDEYAGKIQLKNDFMYDNTDFVKKLESKGFYVPEVSYTNYPNTGMSIPSFFNMNYLDFLTEELGKDSKDMRLAQELTDNNVVMKFLKLHNYKITTFYGGFDAIGNTNLVSEKLCGLGILNTSMRENFVLTYLPITYFNPLAEAEMKDEVLECLFTTVPKLKGSDEIPVFVLAHFVLPHDPFIYDSEGNLIKPEKLSKGKEPYLEQLIYTSKKILVLVDKILENATRESVIIIISDHGYRAEIDWENPSNENYVAGFNNLAAYYMPNQMDNIPETFSAVNIFRIIFNSYLGTEFEMLEDRQIWYTPDRPFDFTDVTDKLPK
jgi:hypothetical protein